MRARTCFVLSVCTVAVAAGQHLGAPTDELDKLSVDELFTLQVTSVGRKAQQLSKAPAAVFVLTAEDIRRSGATSIPEALEWVPGLTVLRVDGRSWVVSARGSARLYANRMLVMIDGRSLYTPLFSGVIWDAIDVPLGDIEQIEVVRGPGAVMWGPNAVNGVINIITRKAGATKGGEVTVAKGNDLAGSVQARWGAAVGDRLSYRVWGKAEYRTPANSSPGNYLLDNTFLWRSSPIGDLNEGTGRLGFRLDGQPTEKDQWTLQGDMYKTGRHEPLAFAELLPDGVDTQAGHTAYSGGYLQGRWTRSSSPGSESILQFSFARDNLDYPFVGGTTDNSTLEFQRRTQTGESNELYWGLGFQQYSDDTYSSRYAALVPPQFRYRAGDVAIRDEWQAVPGRLLFSAGVRLDYNSYHHVEYQPSFRLLFTPNPRQSAWLALSRAARLPNRFDRDMIWDGGSTLIEGQPVQTVLYPTARIFSEVERSAEAGYRIQSGQHWSADASVFWSSYTNLVAFHGPPDPVLSGTGDSAVLQFQTWPDNAGAGRSYGGEVWGMWQANPVWRLIPGYSYVNEDWRLPRSEDLFYMWDRTRSNLRHQGTLRSQHELSRSWRLDLMARARSRDTAFDLPGVLLLDARLAWRPGRWGELSISAQNLTGRRVLETYSEGPFVAIPLRRTFAITWRQQF